MVVSILFEVETPLGVKIRTTKNYWQKIIKIKHPSIAKYEREVRETLKSPDQIRRSKQDSRVHLYYKNIGKLNICAVADHEGSGSGYIITCYLTDRVKEGQQIYVKN